MENIFDMVTIPAALQLCLDDVAWHDGRDLRTEGGASRSGLPRDHHPLDYRMLAELGKAIDMKIVCPLCLGDWDKWNLLRGEVGITNKPYTWDRASEIDLEYAEACFNEMESAEYIEYAIHGLMHGRYDENGKLIWEREYFIPNPEDRNKVVIFDADDFNHRLDLFFEIYNRWGFSQKIRTFVSPCGVGTKTSSEEIMERMTAELRKRNVSYWANASFPFKGNFKTYNNIACMMKIGHMGGKEIPWEAYDIDPKYFDTFGASRNIIGMHWTNFLRFNPENNLERLDAWVDFFKRQSEFFGTMISRDIAFSANQQFYRLFSKINVEDGKCIIDLSDVEMQKNVKGNDIFYISFKNGLVPSSCEGGTIKLYETHNEFSTYEIKHDNDKVVISF